MKKGLICLIATVVIILLVIGLYVIPVLMYVPKEDILILTSHDSSSSSSSSLRMSIAIDSDSDPEHSLHPDWKLEEHRKMGMVKLEKRPDGNLYVNGIEVARGIFAEQKTHDGPAPYIIRGELKDKQVLNARIMDVLYYEQQLIPDAWKIGCTCFWGTIFHDSDGRYVEFLYWYRNHWWKTDYFSFDSIYNDKAALNLGSHMYAALLND